MLAQPDLFAPPPMPVLAIEPNRCGVYPPEAAERLILPNPAKNWRGCPWAEIDLLHIEAGWIQSSECWLSEGGYGGPLTARHVYPSRLDALTAAIERIAARCRADGDGFHHGERHKQQCRAVLAWLETLG